MAGLGKLRLAALVPFDETSGDPCMADQDGAAIASLRPSLAEGTVR